MILLVSGDARDNLLAFYMDDQAAITEIVERLQQHGHSPVQPENPYWLKGGMTFENPEGWGVVFMNIRERQRFLDAEAKTASN